MSEHGIDRVRFTPVARPVDTVGVDTTFQRLAAPTQRPTASLAPVMDQMPAPPPQSNRAQQLVEALAGFGQAVGKFGAMYDKQKQDQERMEAEYDAQSSSAKTWEEAVQANPALAIKSPFYKQTFLARTAQNVMMQRFGQLQTEYMQSDLVNSTDPLAVNKWLQEKLQPDLDKITDPEARMAAIGFIRERSSLFMKAHTDNATNTLIRKRQETFSSGMTGSVTDFRALPAAKAYDVGKIFAEDLPMEAQAFLAGLSAGESSGQYNIRYNGGRGAVFDVSQPHPNIRETITSGPNRGKTSSASGKYQFIYGTWVLANDGTNPAMTEANQDRAAWKWAQKTYKEQTGGGDLLDELKKNGLTQGTMRALGGQWEAWSKGGRDDLARYAATYNETLKGRGGSVPENAAAANPNFNALQAKLWDDHGKMVAGGEKVENADAILIKTVVNSVLETGDQRYFDILKESRNGRPALALQPEVAKTIFDTVRRSEALVIDRHNAQVKAAKLRKEADFNAFVARSYTESVQKVREGKDPSYSQETIAAGYRMDPDYGDRLIRMNKTWTEMQTQEDPREVNNFWRDIYSGRMSPERLQEGVANGLIKSPQTFKSMADEIESQKKQDWMSSAPWRSTMEQLDRFHVDPDGEKPDLARQHAEVQGALKKSFGEWMAADPARRYDYDGQRVFLDKQLMALMRSVNPDNFSGLRSAFDTRTPSSQPAPATTVRPQAAPAPAPKAGEAKPQAQAAPIEAATRGTDWRTKRVFGSAQELDDALKAWQANPADTNGALAQMAAKLGISGGRELFNLYKAQKALLGT